MDHSRDHAPLTAKVMTDTDKLPLVAICVPSTGTWKAKMGHDLCLMCCLSLAHANLILCNQESSSIGDSRNRMVLDSRRHKVDYLMFVDTDMVFPEDGLARLIAHDKDIVGATYNRRVPPYDTLGEWEPFTLANDKIGLARAKKMPTGFLLVKASVFERLKPPWFFEAFGWDNRSDANPTGHASDDYVFMLRAHEAGIEAYIDFDLSFEIGHIGEQIIAIQRPQIGQLGGQQQFSRSTLEAAKAMVAQQAPRAA